jgi:hypothetical protein
MSAKKTGHIRLTEASGFPILEVAVPRGTTVAQSLKVIERLDSVIERLTGCPCISGLDLRLRDLVLLPGKQSFSEQVELPG